MNNSKILLGTGLLAIGAMAWAAKDPVIMTVNGVDVPKSEFEYLYHKNSQQQLDAQPIDEYVEMFKNYKLKVADAKALGIDTTGAFKREMAQYRRELAAPYLTDSTYLNSLVDEAYERSLREVPTSHIMLFKTANRLHNEQSIARLDSIRGLLMQGQDYTTLAEKYSQDGQTARNGGSLGYIMANRYPYSFETAAYSLKPGEVSKVVESPMAYHLIKVGESRPARGTVLVEHIMRLVPPGATPEQAEAVKATVDSIYRLVRTNPDRFEALAIEKSEDPGSASKGGQLPWFGTGQMVPEFEETSFALNTGEISAPVKTRYGWHIIRKLDSRPVPSKDQMRPQLLQRVQHPQDERSGMIRDHQTATLEKKLKGKYTKELSALRREIAANGLDSLFYARYENTPAGALPIIAIGKNTVSLSEFIPSLRHLTQQDGIEADRLFMEDLNKFYNLKLVDAEIDRLEAEVPEYRNLYHEYYDGSLLYEVSVREVWDRASKDQEGLERYFDEHRGDYTWTEPRVKGYLVQAKNDSVADAVKIRYMELGADSALNVIRDEFKNDIKIDRVLAPKGVNAMVDNIMFGTQAVQPTVAGFTAYFMLDPRMLEAPEEMADVRALVTSDYQTYLEQAWLEALKAKYPVVINQKVLKTVKSL
ncbi:MAG: peptidylprolyl isomerase [Muribaculum sp.]|nr:peptidylprolyl isomerase [Muribaculum sp.]